MRKNTMDKPDSTMAQQIVRATSVLEQEETGLVPKSVTVVQSDDTLVLTSGKCQSMVCRFFCAATLLMLGSCTPGLTISSQPDPAINTELVPLQSSILDAQGNTQEVASSQDADGVQTDFIVGLVRLRRAGQADLQAFLDRYGGTVVSDDAVPEPPAGSGITLTDEQRQPTEYVVQIDLSLVDASSFAANAAAQGIADGFSLDPRTVSSTRCRAEPMSSVCAPPMSLLTT